MQNQTQEYALTSIFSQGSSIVRAKLLSNIMRWRHMNARNLDAGGFHSNDIFARPKEGYRLNAVSHD